MIGYAIVTSIFTLIFGLGVQFAYKHLLAKDRYAGITKTEGGLIFVGSFPGLAGCSFGGFGAGIPVPLILGLPFKMLFIGSSSCGWADPITAILSDPSLTMKVMVMALLPWGLTNYCIVSVLYIMKFLKNRKANKENPHG